MNRLDEALRNARSIENRKAFGAEDRETRYIGCKSIGGNVYHLYEDTAGSYWYSSELTDRVDAELKHIENRRRKMKRPA